jgi:Transmembrane secretion effector
MLIAVEFKIDCTRGPEFLSLMREVRLIQLRNGAYSCRLHEDLTRSNTFRLELVVPFWNEHLLQRERMTKAEKEVLVETWSLHMGATSPEEHLPIGQP